MKTIFFTQALHIIPNVGDNYIDAEGVEYKVVGRTLLYNNKIMIHLERISQ